MATVVKNPEKKKAERKRRLFILSMLAFPVAHFLIFFVYININTISLSLQRLNFMTNEVRFVGLSNFLKFFDDYKTNPVLPKALFNSLMFIPVTNFILLPLSILCAYVLFKKVPMHKVFRTVFFAPSIISIVILTMVFSFMFDSTFGVFNSFLKLIGLESLQRVWFGDPATAMPMVFLYCVWAGIGYNVVLLNGAISRIPTEIIEYGQLEGIGMMNEMCRVVIPMIWPTISTVFIMGSTSAFTIFLQPKLLTGGGPNGASYTIALYIIDQVNAGNLEYAAAVGIFFAVIGVLIIMAFKAILDRVGQTVEY